MNFIMLHNKDNTPIRVNVSKIISYRKCFDRYNSLEKTIIQLSGKESTLYTRETPEQIDSMLGYRTVTVGEGNTVIMKI